MHQIVAKVSYIKALLLILYIKYNTHLYIFYIITFLFYIRVTLRDKFLNA